MTDEERFEQMLAYLNANLAKIGWVAEINDEPTEIIIEMSNNDAN